MQLESMHIPSRKQRGFSNRNCLGGPPRHRRSSDCIPEKKGHPCLRLYSPSVMKSTSQKSRSAGLSSHQGARGQSSPACCSSRHSFHLLPPSACVLLLHVCFCVFLPLHKDMPAGFRAHLDNQGQSLIEVLNSFMSAKTLLPIKVPFACSEGWGISFDHHSTHCRWHFY